MVKVNYPYRILYIRFVGTPCGIRRNRCNPDGKEAGHGHQTNQNRTGLPGRTREIDRLMDAEPETPEGDRLDVLATFVEAWEEKHFPLRSQTLSRPSSIGWKLLA